MSLQRERKIQELRDLIDGIEVCMMTSSDGGGQLHSRPLQTQQMDADGHLWFLTTRSTRVVGEVHGRPAICLNYASRERNTYVAVYGSCQEIFDQAKISELWTPAHEVFFPAGRHDPDLTLLRVTPEMAECWTGPSGTVGRMLAFAGAALTGDQRLLGDKHDIKL